MLGRPRRRVQARWALGPSSQMGWDTARLWRLLGRRGQARPTLVVSSHDATKQIGLFDTDDDSIINLDPIYISALDFKKHTILGLKDISTEKSEPTKVEDSAMERFFIKYV